MLECSLLPSISHSYNFLSRLVFPRLTHEVLLLPCLWSLKRTEWHYWVGFMTSSISFRESHRYIRVENIEESSKMKQLEFLFLTLDIRVLNNRNHQHFYYFSTQYFSTYFWRDLSSQVQFSLHFSQIFNLCNRFFALLCLGSYDVTIPLMEPSRIPRRCVLYLDQTKFSSL